MRRRQVRTPHIANKQGVAGKHRPRLVALFFIGYQQTNALWRVAGRGQHFDLQLAHTQRVAVVHINVRERRSRVTRQINLSARTRRQFAVSGDEVGVQVRFKNVADPQLVLPRRLKIDLYIALRIDDNSLALRSKQVGRMRQAAEIELLNVHRMASILRTTQRCALEKILRKGEEVYFEPTSTDVAVDAAVLVVPTA